MPTPFTHLEIAQRLIIDSTLTDTYRNLLREELSAFLLGSIAADARVGAGTPREASHFYAYGENITVPLWRRMVTQYPSLLNPHSVAHKAFLAGYVAHLSVDEHWAKYMVAPHFVAREWAPQMQRFFMLHIILTHMDERDLSKLDAWHAEVLCDASPDNWLPFMEDENLVMWRDLIHEQITPDGESQTLQIFGQRLGRPTQDLRDLLDSDAKMQSRLWDHISKDILTEIENGMYAYAREQMTLYLDTISLNS